MWTRQWPFLRRRRFWSTLAQKVAELTPARRGAVSEALSSSALVVNLGSDESVPSHDNPDFTIASGSFESSVHGL